MGINNSNYEEFKGGYHWNEGRREEAMAKYVEGDPKGGRKKSGKGPEQVGKKG